jgi:hydrogenase maturation protein HypF
MTAALEIRVRGRVQGVGFRPTVWRLARDCGLSGEVLNDGEGVLVRVGGEHDAIVAFMHRLERESPPLARIDRIETRDVPGPLPAGFRIVESAAGEARTQIAPDAAICSACAAEVLDPLARRFRYPFTTCTHCGPRLSIVTTIPYDRARTTLAPFALCPACLDEYRAAGDRRFHAEAIACGSCGPKARLIRPDGRAAGLDRHAALDDVDVAGRLIRAGEIVAIKGLGSYHLACDATSAEIVERLRLLKGRDAKPFALMARDMEVIRRYCRIDPQEEDILRSAVAPIVLLRADGAERLPDAVAPGLNTLGFMLPTTPLHLLLLRRIATPVVMTSGNLSEEPPVIRDDEATSRLGTIASYVLVHDRAIANRVDDSVVRLVAGAPRVMRRARGYAPAPITLPPGFETAPALLAYGGELKATFCLVRDGQAVLSQHLGDLENEATYDEYRRALDLYAAVFDHRPAALVVDTNPEYLSAKLARDRSRSERLPLIEVQHHHAHVAACLAENNHPRQAPPVLGIVLDGVGWGDDGTIWGGEFLLADYQRAERLATFKPVAMPGGAQAVRQPWRNLYAHLMAGIGWTAFSGHFGDLPLHAYLAGKPRAMLDAMVREGINAPTASSCGRLFDAFAAAIGICPERQSYEGQAAACLEALVDERALREEPVAHGYPFAIAQPRGSRIPHIEPITMWRAALGDLMRGVAASVMAARFHKGLAAAIVTMADRLAGPDRRRRFERVVLSGGCFQNRILFEQCVSLLEAEGFTVLSHAHVPANDGGLALGQAAIAAARLIATQDTQPGG